MAPLAGEQILTVLSTVAVHCAEAKLADTRRKVATRKPRRMFTRAPFQNKSENWLINFPSEGAVREQIDRMTQLRLRRPQIVL